MRALQRALGLSDLEMMELGDAMNRERKRLGRHSTGSRTIRDRKLVLETLRRLAVMMGEGGGQ